MQSLAFAAAGFIAVASANPISSESVVVAAAELELAPRMLPNAPNGYIPQAADCPSTSPTLRVADGLSQQERNWLPVRRNATIEPMRDFLQRANIPNFNVGDFFTRYSSNASALPNIGIAVSGGGYRALMTGAGMLEAFDNRTSGATSSGGLGGLLQSATYLSGLSGGSWLVSSLYANNFTTVQSIVSSSNQEPWDFSRNLFEGPSSDFGILSTADYWHDIANTVDGKRDAGYNISVTDYWGRALSYQLINAPDGGPGYTWSSIALQDIITAGQAPLPIVIADSRAPGQRVVPDNTTIFEFNPWEMGSWDPTTYGFAPLEYVGTNFTAGSVPSGQQCVRGFDNAGYVLGTSSTLFNEGITQLNQTALPDFIRQIFTNILEDIAGADDDIADWSPNPFYQFNPTTNLNADSHRLTLVDGGEDGQNVPLHPLIQPDRELDVIFAVDSSADTIYNWPNGTSLVATYERSINSTIQNGTSFPYVPDQNTFVNLGLNTRPTFFGCNASNFTHSRNTGLPAPLIVYLPNSYYSFQGNFSTFDPTYTTEERDLAIRNAYNVATRGNDTVGKEQYGWPTCVACAVLSRSFDKTGTAYPAACTACFEQYCWNGTIASGNPTESLLNQTAALPEGNTTTGKNAAGALTAPTMQMLGSLAVGVTVLSVLL